MRSESARCVLHFIPSFIYHLCLAYGRNQSWSFRCRCVSTATQKLHRGMWTKSYAHSIMVYSDSCSRPLFSPTHSLNFWEWQPLPSAISLFAFSTFFRTVSAKLTSRMEVRVAYTLAIAMGAFTACWIPLIIAMGFFIGKPLVKGNIHLLMWLWTLALSNSAMNFLIYSAKIQEFKEAFVSIIRKMSTDVPLVECSRFAKVLKNFSKFELEISHHPKVQVEGIYAWNLRGGGWKIII